jgi:hypothetical protein
MWLARVEMKCVKNVTGKPAKKEILKCIPGK